MKFKKKNKFKTIKLFVMGARMRSIYPYATRFEVIKYKVARFFRNLVKVLLIALVAYILAIVFFPRYKEVEKLIKVDNLSIKTSELKNEILDSLKACESQGSKESDGLIIFDSNKKASIGLYQFQVKTVIHYYKTLYQKDITGKEAIEISLNEKLSRQLASDIIFTDSKGIDNWYNCKNKKGLAENIKWVNKISK